MPKLIKERSKKAGLPPGTLVHIGEQKSKEILITVVDYDNKGYFEKITVSADEVCSMEQKTEIRWINVDGIHRVEVMEKLGNYYGLHPLVLEDILNTDQRPKIEDYGDYIYIVARLIYYDEKTNHVTTEQVSIILGKNFVITFQENNDNIFFTLKERIRKGSSKIGKMGTDYLVYALLDFIVDSYFVVIEKLGDKIEYTEDNMVLKPGPIMLQSIHDLKREMLYLHKAIWPLREVIGALERRESYLIQESTVLYLRDVYDHTIQLMDSIETYRDMLSGMLDIYLSSVSLKMNEVMKVLTIFSTIFMPLTFLAGVYGMNFKYMPELEWPLSYPLLMLGMAITAVLMILFFKKKKWI